MKTVLICDFCPHTENESVEGSHAMNEHEENCAFNPKNKTCYTCKNKWMCAQTTNEGCTKDLKWWDMEEEGNCEGWEEKKD